MNRPVVFIPFGEEFADVQPTSDASFLSFSSIAAETGIVFP
jgi:hypothetical protein